ncbi:hypothetical protein QBC38DRAFT_451334 [Podospora fimiseda]|uniref:Uncharacterized protein n=1 Tax=Podospora fimiseda TaxID=252190 RepID=A0AAN7H7N3_9PEZI|nr:hypothetical protein QBC38DRAFT_451334 [Podospora fimiseda]
MATLSSTEGLHATPDAARDIRQAGTERKRDKDHTSKWSYGHRDPQIGNAKFRPNKIHVGPAKPHSNFVKGRAHWNAPQTQFRTKLHAKSEIQASIDWPLSGSGDWIKGLGSPVTSRSSSFSASSNDPYLYSFDRTDTPGAPLSLAAFVKAPSAQETDRLIKKEWAVVDATGENVLSGRKATRMLRNGQLSDPPVTATLTQERSLLDDEGFELL